LMLGDPTAKERKRLSINPIRHVDPFGTLILPGLLALTGAPVFGWAKPDPVIKERLRNPRLGMMAVAAVDPGTIVVLAAIGAIALCLVGRGGLRAEGATGFAAASLYSFVLINIFLARFNLLPLPPFDGSHIVEGLLPARAARIYEKLRPFGFQLLFLLLLVIPWLFPGLGLGGRVVLPAVQWAEARFMTVASWIAGG